MAKDNPNLSPEKQLLKLIEDPAAASSAGQRSFRRKGVSFFSLSGIMGGLAFFKGLGASGLPWAGPWDIKRINDLLLVAVLATGGYFVANAMTLSAQLRQLPVVSARLRQTPKTDYLEGTMRLAPLGSYLEKVRSRDIFRIGKKADQELKAPEVQTAVAVREQEILADYKLVGISWSKNPDAMVENTKTNKTYFLKRGQSVDGVRVDEIYKDRVVLSYGGQSVDLR